MRLTGAHTIVALLERQGITIIPGIPGGANLPLYDALSQSRAIHHVLARHEQGAGFMAQGMARVTGKPQVCFATSGPGATNVLTAIADAKLDSIPVICITGQVSRAMIGTDAFQEVDTYGMSIPITKHNYLVRSAQEILGVLPEAFRVAASGRPGPVLIDVPKDVQLEAVEFDAWPEPGRADAPVAPSEDEVRSAAEMINASERPILCLGGGVMWSLACEAGRRLAETASMPVTMSLMGLGAVPSSHPLSLGMLGMHAARHTNLALEECDLFVAVGMRFDDRATGRVASFLPKARILHIDTDASEIDKIKPAERGIVADARLTLDRVLPLVARKPRREWLSFIDGLKAANPADDAAPDTSTPRGLIRAVARIVGDEAIISTDVGQHQMWAAQHYPLARPRQWLTSGGLGTMGFGFPAAIGAAFACPERTVVSLSGDGSLLMNIQELATAAEEKVNVKVIVFNNGGLGLVRQQQDLFYGKRLFASDFAATVDYAAVAEGFGVRAFDLAKSRAPLEMLTEALTSRGPCLVNAPIAPGEQVLPMVPPGAANVDMIGGHIDE